MRQHGHHDLSATADINMEIHFDVMQLMAISVADERGNHNGLKRRRDDYRDEVPENRSDGLLAAAIRLCNKQVQNTNLPMANLFWTMGLI